MGKAPKHKSEIGTDGGKIKAEMNLEQTATAGLSQNVLKTTIIHVYLTKKHVFLGQMDSSQVLRAKSGSFVAY